MTLLSAGSESQSFGVSKSSTIADIGAILHLLRPKPSPWVMVSLPQRRPLIKNTNGPTWTSTIDRQHHLRGTSSGSRPIPPNPADNGPHEGFRNFHPGDQW